jgi:oligosaccharide reducing-end xylanase
MLVLGVAFGIWSCGSENTTPAGSDGVAGSGGLASGIGGTGSGIGGTVNGSGGSGVGGNQGSGGSGVGGSGIGGLVGSGGTAGSGATASGDGGSGGGTSGGTGGGTSSPTGGSTSGGSGGGTSGGTGGGTSGGTGGGMSGGAGGGTSGGAGGGTSGGAGGDTSGGAGGSTSGGAGGSTSGGAGGGTSGGTGGGTAGDGGASTVTIPGDGCTPPAAYANLFVSLSGHTQAETDAKLETAWSTLFNPSGSGSIYFDGPGSDESYVLDTYNSDVRTEGMGYGMMIAVQLDKQTEFDRQWTWVRNHMASGCSASGCTGAQIAWHCSTSGSKLATGGAPDGDEYFAAALIFAHNRWGDTSGKFDYATEAQWVLDLVRTQDFNSTYHLVKFYSGSDNGQTDPSYILPAFYQTWACFDTANAEFWETAVTAGRELFHAAADANGVFGDQCSYTGGSSVNTGVDKIRTVMNIMMDWNFFAADPWQRDTYAPLYGAHEQNIGPGAQGFCDALLGFGLPASTGKPFVDRLWSAAVPRSYWDGTLYMLALLHVSGTFRLWY